MMQVGACGLGWARSVAFARASLMAVKAVTVSSSQTKWRVPSSEMLSNLFSGSKMAGQLGTKRWWKLIRPRNSRSFRSDVG
jgi:hypothetical protein